MPNAPAVADAEERIGIIAGSGQFPFLVARGAAERGLGVVICGIAGNADPALAEFTEDFVMLPVGQLNKLIKFFKSRKVGRLCMAGAVSKVKALDIRPDFRAAGLIIKLAGKGDDALLRAVADILQGEGFNVVRPDDLVPGLRCSPGVLGKIQPDAYTRKDMEFGITIAENIGAMDIGQCVAVRRGIVVAVEAVEGTDAALIRGGELGGAGCTAVKVLKPGQDKRMDLPSVGAGTLEIMARYRYACLAFDARGTLFFDREAALAEADAAGIAVVAF
ncbi:MAG: UDP-2,3-diacylglucosamine diphosphatase LpxI [Desulfovibrio sp.]|jgi:DUF1009 family protein|nr:UDP-2,3-diacylglucosamine diphosphatase LpxI [Desulfovibrio sp.]